MGHVSFSIFGRGEKLPDAPTSLDEVTSSQSPAPASVPPFREVAGAWRAQLAKKVRAELGADRPARVLLTSPHPAGLARLYAERSTKLSALVRDQVDLAQATAAVMGIVRQAQEMTDKHGSATIHLAIGSATWVEGQRRRRVPIILRPVELTVEDDGEITLDLRPGVEVSNSLLDMLARQGAPIEPAQLLDGVRSPTGFSPTDGIAMIRSAAATVPGLEVLETLTLGIFVHPTSALLRELGAPQWLSLSPVARALAGDQGAKAELEVTLPDPNPYDRDPWGEKGIGDQTPAMQDVIEAATAGYSLLIRSSGQRTPHVAASIAAEHAGAGDQVLVVTGSPVLSREIQQCLEDQGVSDVSHVIQSSRESAEKVREALKTALMDASDTFDADAVNEMRTRLRRVRESLADYTSSLHEVFPQWGVSAVDALQELTDLTSIPGGPSTTVRLPADVLSAISADQGQQARDLLAQASALGVFAPTSSESWWNAVEISDPEVVQQALAALERLNEDLLPRTRMQMSAVSGEAGLITPYTVRQWSDQLRILGGIRESLDVFQPEIFDRSAADMVIATATKQWRKERGIQMRGSQRRRLVSQAKDLQIPGRYVPDLHEELMLAQARREEWREIAQEGSWPRLPANFDSLVELNNTLQEDLKVVEPYLAPAYGDVWDMDVEDLSTLISTLLEDSKGARELPARVRTLQALDEIGLGELVADLRERGVDGEMLSLELDLAWWASALGLMLAEEPRLGGLDPASLQNALSEERQLDEAQVASLGPAIRHKILRRRAGALATQADAYVKASQAFATPASAATYYARVPMAWQLMPIVITAPTLASHVVPWGRHVDTVILAGVERLELAELIPIIARGRQVIVVGSVDTPTVQALEDILPTVKVDSPSRPLTNSVLQLLSDFGVAGHSVSVPGRHSASSVRTVVVEGTGMPAPGKHAIESSTAEVDRIVELIREHAREREGESLAVVALNERHADRIISALGRAVSRSPEEFPQEVPVLSVDEAEDIQPDHLLVAVGYAKTPHGRVIHDFGPYSQPGGELLLAKALHGARGDLTVVSAMSADELDPERLRQPGARMLRALLRLGEGEESAGQWPTTEAAPDHLLVDLAERLYRLGLDVVPNLGFQGGMRIPLAIGHPEAPGQLLVAILTDDDEYLNEPSQRVRDRLIPQILESQGWKVRRELSMAVFIDPNREAEAIVRLVLDAVDEQRGADTTEVPEDQLIETDSLFDNAPTGTVMTVFEDDVTGILQPTSEDAEPEETDAEEPPSQQPVRDRQETSQTRGIRPAIAPGLPLAAYGDDQLDEMAHWVLSSADLSDKEAVEELRLALELGRHGPQIDAVLSNVIKRCRKQHNDNRS